MPVDRNEALNRLSKAIQIQTVSSSDYEATDFTAFEDFLKFVKEAFPLFHKECEFSLVNGYSMLFRWKGTDEALDPILLMAHYDVVPAENEGWNYPPFSGAIKENRVWGRGTLDIKSQLTAHMEAAQTLMLSGFKPKRDIYFAYGHDEETGGVNGADKVADELAKRGIRFSGVLDEGGIVVTGAIKGVKSPLALIGVAEKGRADFEVTVKGAGGHSSMPSKVSVLGQLAKFIGRLEKNPMPARLTTPVVALLESIAPEMGKGLVLALKAKKIATGAIALVLSQSPETNAMIRTTTVATTISGSSATNVLPQSATVNINARLLPGDSLKSVGKHLKKLAGKIPLSIRLVSGVEASPISPADGEFYGLLVGVIKEVYPSAKATPYLVMGGTDSRKYAGLCRHVYRFTPVSLTNEEKDTVHNANECISIDNYMSMVDFFKKLIRRL
jgi:carboxypeptidase PM20D1